MKKNLFRIICTVLLAAMLLPLAACGNNAANAADSVYGKYICIGEDRDDGVFLDPDFDSYVELKKGGKSSMNVGFDLELTYELDGENFTGTYTLMGIDYNITGTLKDNVLEVIDGTRKSRYLKEGATAPGSSYDFSANTLAGDYYISTMILNGQALDHNALIAAGMADNTYIKINSDDTGVYSFNGEAERTFTLDTMSGVLTFYGGATLTFVDEGEGTVSVLYPDQNMNNMDIQFLRDRLRDKKYLPLAYFDGASPENGYTPSNPLTIQLYSDPRPQDCEAGYMRMFLKTKGADSPRLIKLRQKPSTGEWFLWKYSSVLTGIRIPAALDPWA